MWGFKINYNTEIASHMLTCYKALEISSKIDERAAMENLVVGVYPS